MPWRSVAGRRIGTFDASSFADIVCSLIAHQNEVQLCNQEHPGTYIYIIYILHSQVFVFQDQNYKMTQDFFSFPERIINQSHLSFALAIRQPRKVRQESGLLWSPPFFPHEFPQLTPSDPIRLWPLLY